MYIIWPECFYYCNLGNFEITFSTLNNAEFSIFIADNSLFILIDGRLLKNCNARYGSFEGMQAELQAYVNAHVESSFEYLLMSTHFGNYEANREGFKGLYRKLSDSAWGKAIDIIKFITKRGGRMNFNQLPHLKKNVSIISNVFLYKNSSSEVFHVDANLKHVQKSLRETQHKRFANEVQHCNTDFKHFLWAKRAHCKMKHDQLLCPDVIARKKLFEKAHAERLPTEM